MDTNPDLIHIQECSAETRRLAAMLDEAKASGMLYSSNIYVVHAVIDFYLTGELHLPTDICAGSVPRELKVWGLQVDQLATCCRARYEKALTRCQIMNQLNEDFLVEAEQKAKLRNEMGDIGKVRTQLFQFLEDPFSSKAARIWSVFVALLIIVSIIAFAFETVSEENMTQRGNTSGRKGPKRTNDNFIIRNPHKSRDQTARIESTRQKGIGKNDTANCALPLNDKTNSSLGCSKDGSYWWTAYILRQSSMPLAIQVLEISALSVLTLELFVRFLVYKSKKIFLMNPWNILDIVSTLPTWGVLGIYYVMKNALHSSSGYVFALVICLRILRLIRLLRLARQYKPLRVILLTAQACRRQLLLLLILFIFAGVMSGAVVFYTEIEMDIFPSIMHAYWWSIITLTTIGYGDYVPVTSAGRVLGALCAFCGILSITIIIPVISNYFMIFYDGLRMNEKKSDQKATNTMDIPTYGYRRTKRRTTVDQFI